MPVVSITDIFCAVPCSLPVEDFAGAGEDVLLAGSEADGASSVLSEDVAAFEPAVFVAGSSLVCCILCVMPGKQIKHMGSLITLSGHSILPP